MEAKEIRQQFLDFFKNKEHQIVPSAPLVVKNDPTLMFINAGMNQFKDYFLGNKVASNPRVADTQKCLRVSGKHNDLEEVGLDTYHHTLFEMLGNWSFGDYFKKEAIAWAWELLTDVYRLPKDRLYVTVFEGDEKDGLEPDKEAAELWKAFVEEDRILYASKKDNFWEMGDSGPCGPCSEIHIDLRDEADVAKVPGKDLVNQDDPLVVEIWNLVFIQFNRLASGELKKLPDTHVDTGMGFERLVMAIQKKKSNYDTDVFTPLISYLAKKADVKYGDDEKVDIAIRVISDHIRAISFAIADGQLPSNNKAGYVIRRILRRAVRYGTTFLNFKEPFMYELVDILGEQFGEVFPEILSQKAFIQKVIKEEESSFLRTLEKGLAILGEYIEKNEGSKKVDGKAAFVLYDTYGFPYDLTALIAGENGFEVDEQGFKEAMAEQRRTSQIDATSETGDWIVVNEGDEVEFVGYEALESESKILRYREVKEKKKTLYQLVLETTPFYAESGGQVGDKGYLEADGEKIAIFDTKKENDLIIQFAPKLPKDLSATFRCVVDESKRRATENNHSATHLLQAALKQVLGDHIAQKGSYVNESILRFDFSHFAKMTDEEIREVEQLVNAKIRENIALDEKRNVPIEDAKAMGATALFGEKYGEFVRMITFDKDYSVELCGGTHVPATGKIGMLKITSESSVAAGVRRIEAITGEAMEEFVVQQDSLLKEVEELLKNPKDLVKAVQSLVDEKNAIAKSLATLQQKELQNLKKDLVAQAKEINGVNYIAAKVSVPDNDSLRALAFETRKLVDNLFMVLGTEFNGKPMLAVMISDELVKEKEMHAGKIVKELAKNIKGGGGGQPFFATAGGKDASGLEKALADSKELL
ncbi:alanine--tRNA ligase [Flammeovirgaceae bacterium SG7u.111]|nr:alanine--tRNA ligase [Flammeovirgaceae bacterium SG7u.132]WPO33009.1 alanine--tRNA ligase [Flammeovirgaceae bacterium SG7u.111]